MQLLGGHLVQRHLHLGRAGRGGARRAARHDPHLAGVEGREVGEVGVTGRGSARQRVRPGPQQRPHGHRQPVERPAGLTAYGTVGGGALLGRHVRLDDQRGVAGVARVGQRVPQGRVADRARERGERGEDDRRQQDGEERGGQQQAVRPRPQHDETRQSPEPRHTAPQPSSPHETPTTRVRRPRTVRCVPRYAGARVRGTVCVRPRYVFGTSPVGLPVQTWGGAMVSEDEGRR
ncbi:hypothetical protein GCM10020256_50800 [Streptomyces thermocoprophilus]